ncbi:MAG: hypothetical protein WKF89_19010 [Chitinophagaceae bacterium]
MNHRIILPSFRIQFFILLSCFILSRLIAKLSGISFEYAAIFDYWQYLNVKSLRENLLLSLWYQHSQPPVFNFLLGVVLKCSGSYAPLAFEILFLLITFSNGYLLFHLLRKTTAHKYLPLIASCLYLLNPATILFENELFYTSFTSLLLLISSSFLLNFVKTPTSGRAFALFATLTLLCLTRSNYHLFLLMVICGILIFQYYNKKGVRLIFIGSLLAVSLVSGWYFKNYFIFKSFSPSSWLGINFARIVFHNENVSDSTTISAIHPFYPISYYKKYIKDDYKATFAGLNDPILLSETKNDSFINMNHAGYLQVSQQYMEAGRQYVAKHPASYLQHTLFSFIIFFSPASSYYKLKPNNDKLSYYDLVCSFNLSHLYSEEKKRRIALAVSAIPLFCIYFMVIFITIRDAIRSRFISTLHAVIMTIIFFILAISTVFEYGENMRFRYELHPLFMVLAADVVVKWLRKNNRVANKTAFNGKSLSP